MRTYAARSCWNRWFLSADLKPLLCCDAEHWAALLTLQELQHKSDHELQQLWRGITTLRGRSYILKLLLDRHGPDYQLEEVTGEAVMQ